MDALLQSRIDALLNRMEALFQEQPLSFSMYSACLERTIPLEQEFINLLKNSPISEEEYRELEQMLLSRKIQMDEAYKIQFIDIIFASTDPKTALFDLAPNIPMDSQYLTDRYRKIARKFHPDKIPDTMSAENKQKFTVFFQLLADIYEELKEGASCKSAPDILRMQLYIAEAHQQFEHVKDYSKCINKKWDELKLLDSDEMKRCSTQELKELKKFHALKTYSLYRQALIIADRIPGYSLMERIDLRKWLAMALLMIEHYLESQLYVLAGLHLCERLPMNEYNPKRSELKKLLSSIKLKAQAFKKPPAADEGSSSAASASNLHVPSGNSPLMLRSAASTDIVPYGLPITAKQRRQYQEDLQNDIIDLCRCLASPSRSLASTQIHEKYISNARAHANMRKVGSVMLGVGGVALAGAGICTFLSFFVLDVLSAGLLTAVLVPASLILGGGAVGGGYYAAAKAKDIFKEPELRESYNQKIQRCLQFFDEEEYLSFLIELSTPPLEGHPERLIILDEDTRKFVVDADYIIDIMEAHGFRVETIAYMLTLISEVLLSRKVSLSFMTQKALDGIANTIYNSIIYSQKLTDLAQALDKQIKRFHKVKEKTPWGVRGIRYFFTEYYDIPAKDLNDASEMSFECRLEELRSIARIDLAMLYLFDQKPNLEEVRKLLSDVSKHMEKSTLFGSLLASRKEVIDDFMRAYDLIPAEIPKEAMLAAPEKMLIADAPHHDEVKLEVPEFDMEEEIRNIVERLADPKLSKPERLHLLNREVKYFEKLVKYLGKKPERKPEELVAWFRMNQVCRKILEIAPKDINAHVGYIKSLYYLNRFVEAKARIEKYSSLLKNSFDFILLKALCLRRLGDYSQAKFTLTSLYQREDFTSLHEHYPAFRREVTILNNLMRKPEHVEELTNLDKVQKYKDRLLHQQDGRRPSEDDYFILSINGGGIRGILPALWLAELEAKTHRPASSLFSMIAGTSTGGIIAGLLSTPAEHDNTRPRYTAADAAELYVTRARDVFTYRRAFIRPLENLWLPKFTDAGRSAICKEYYKDVELKDMLTEVVIPATDEHNVAHPHLFTREKAKRSPHDNFLLRDVCMATSAAPTFFPPYPLKGRTYLDGGVQANHPGLEGFNQAVNMGIEPERIHVISLGTGEYLPDPLNPSKARGLLFWAANLAGVALPANEGIVHQTLNSQLGERYYRWQAYLDSPIALDGVTEPEIKRLVDIAEMSIEEEYASEDNRLNGLIERLSF